jgi:hypothetical protein
VLRAKSVVASIKSSFLVYSLSLSLFTFLRAFECDSSSVVSSSFVFHPTRKVVVVVVVSLECEKKRTRRRRLKD